MNIQYSQRGQDLFAVNILHQFSFNMPPSGAEMNGLERLLCASSMRKGVKGKKDGTFLDFGCRGPIDINNTYLLEKEYNFKGLSFDIDSSYIREWQNTDRNYNNAIECDLLNNFDFALEKMDDFYDTNIIDYFSFDLEPPLLTLEVLKKIPFEKYKFGVVTFEHDFYRGFDTLHPSRKIFTENGYRKIKKEYMHLFDKDKGIHLSEDWWIHPDVITVDEILLETNLLIEP